MFRPLPHGVPLWHLSLTPEPPGSGKTWAVSGYAARLAQDSRVMINLWCGHLPCAPSLAPAALHGGMRSPRHRWGKQAWPG